MARSKNIGMKDVSVTTSWTLLSALLVTAGSTLSEMAEAVTIQNKDTAALGTLYVHVGTDAPSAEEDTFEIAAGSSQKFEFNKPDLALMRLKGSVALTANIWQTSGRG